jgi:5-methylcytosine-specific restriction endonuclease McrA
MEDTKTLKLDSSFRPLEVIDAVEALVLCLIGKAQTIEIYSKAINSVNKSFQLPCVIALNRFVRFRYKTIPCHKRNIIWRDQGRCQYCAKHFATANLTIDHVVPRSKGGKNEWLNLVTACKKCNQKKGSRTPFQASMPLIRYPTIPKSDIFKNIGRDQIIPRWRYYLW